MGRRGEILVALMLPSSIVIGCAMLAITFRYDMQPMRDGAIRMVVDRWAGSVKICTAKGRGYSECFPYLGAGMSPIPKPE